MTVQELIDILQDQNPDADVRLMTQQSWPFENNIRGVTDSEELRRAAGEDDEPPCDCGDPECEDPDPVVYIVEGSQLGYGDKNAWNLC